MDALIQVHRSAAAPQLGPSLFPLSPTLRLTPLPLYASGSSSPSSACISSSGANSLISQHVSNSVTMPTLIEHAQRGGGLMDAHRHHYGPSSPFHDDYMAEYCHATLSLSSAVPIVPTIFSAGVPSYSDPVCSSGPGPRRPSRHCASAFQDLPPFNSLPNLTPSGSFDSEPYYSPSPPFSVGSYSPMVSPPEMPSDHIQHHSVLTTSSNPLYALTVPLEDVEFPPISSVEEISFFRCRWRDCQFWISSDNEAVKNHLTRTHNVVLQKVSERAYCEWVGCSSSPQRSGLVRHFQTHLGLKWLCSVCERAYTRPDCVACHTRRESQCEFAQAISYPSAAEYRAGTINENMTITLTKILHP